MIYEIGQKVVCMDEDYPDWAFELYRKIPIKGHTYTIRKVTIGRSDIEDQGTDSLVFCFLFDEIQNPIDPYFKGGKQELGFNESHFMTLEEFKQKAA